MRRDQKRKSRPLRKLQCLRIMALRTPQRPIVQIEIRMTSFRRHGIRLASPNGMRGRKCSQCHDLSIEDIETLIVVSGLESLMMPASYRLLPMTSVAESYACLTACDLEYTDLVPFSYRSASPEDCAVINAQTVYIDKCRGGHQSPGAAQIMPQGRIKEDERWYEGEQSGIETACSVHFWVKRCTVKDRLWNR